MAMKIPDEDLELSDCEEPVSISKEQLQLLESIKKLGIENTDDVTRLIKNKAKAFGINKESVGDTTPHVNSDTKFSSTYHYPKLATFYGEDNKGEKVNESISNYSSRLEELFNQAVELKGLPRGDDEILKNVLFEGLQFNIKQQAAYKNDMIEDYDKFKIELRKIEAEIKEENQEVRKCAPIVNNSKQDNDLAEVKDLLKKLNERIDQIEKEKEEMKEQYQYQTYRGSFRSRGRSGGYRGRGSRNS
ncbi:hypothetical protein ACF0H5_020329 [Mactra antiquata]